VGTGTAGTGTGSGGPGAAGTGAGSGAGAGGDTGSPDDQPGGVAGGVAGGVEGGTGTQPGASGHGGTRTSPGGDPNLPSPNGLTTPTPGQGANAGAGDGPPGTQRPSQGKSTGTGGDPGTANQPGGHGTSATGTPGGKGQEPSGEGGQSPPHQRTFGDRIIKYFGYLNFEFGGGDPSGESGGVPGGHGTHNWGGWGQALYAVLSVVGAVLMFFGGAELKAAFAGLKAALKTALTAALKVFTREFWEVAGSKIASFFARDAVQFGRRKFGEWFLFRADQGGVTTIVGNIGSKWWPRFQTVVRNLENPGTWAFRDTAAHEGFHAFLAKYAGIVWKAGDKKLLGIPVGAPVKWAEETFAYAIGHANALRIHAIPFAPLEAFGSMSAAEGVTTLLTLGAGGGGYYFFTHGSSQPSGPTPTPVPAR
jgi:hypothetical protein